MIYLVFKGFLVSLFFFYYWK